MSLSRDRLLAAIAREPLAIRQCSICQVPLTFSMRNNKLGFDGSCDCVASFGDQWRPMPIDKLDFYLDPVHGHVSRLTAFADHVLDPRGEVEEFDI